MRAAILDRDEQNTRYLSDIIRQRYGDWNISAYATTFALATAVYDEWKGDLELLIVYAGEDCNIDLAKDLQEYFPHIRLIFYSGTTDCAEKIFRAVPVFFLTLPFQGSKVAEALERVRMGCAEDVGRTLLIQFRGQIQKIRFSAISYMESVGRKMLLYTDSGAFETYMTVEEALDKLPPRFTQCHRSYIINQDRIEKYSVDGAVLTNGTLVPISRSFQKKIREIIGGKKQDRRREAHKQEKKENSDAGNLD